MKAPDKIYIQDYNIPEYGLSTTWTTEKVENDAVHSIEYIRKDALMEWATTNRNKLDALSDNDAVRWGQRNAFQQMIDKLNKM